MKYTGPAGDHYSATSIKGCAKNGRGWKPVCDHPSYCRNDRKTIYLGQQHHLAYGGHWHNNHMPHRLFVHKNQFRRDGMCFYTGNHGGKHRDLCARGNSHWWRTATQNRYYMCARVIGGWNWNAFHNGRSHHVRSFHNVRLGPRNGVPARVYSFRQMKYTGHNGNHYGATSIRGCRRNGHGWKPVCDHPSYCRNDRKAIYLGQHHHMAYGGHWHNNHMPHGLLVWKNRLRQNGMCYYTGNHGGKHQDLCARGNSHWWRRATQSRYYMCAKVTGRWNFGGTSKVVRTYHNIRLGPRNGVPARRYTFREMRYTGPNGNDYSLTARKGCAKNGRGWKPVCDHPSYCRNDRNAIYLGQQHHMAYGGHWHNNYMPHGLFVHKNQFRRDGTCFYTGNHGGRHQNLCARGNSHWWRRATQSRYYMCARVIGGWNWAAFHRGTSRHIRSFHNVRIGAKNGVPARVYSFRQMRYDGRNGGNYADTSIRGCRKNGHGWKPVCDHPSYCRNDRRALYIGQSHHLAYGGHWHNNYMPHGLMVWKNRFRQNGMCFFTGNHGGKHRDLCAHGNSHTWRTAVQNRYYMCGKVTGRWNWHGSSRVIRTY